MDRQRVLADLLRKTADAIDQGTCLLTNAQASIIIDELYNYIAQGLDLPDTDPPTPPVTTPGKYQPVPKFGGCPNC